jgi:hypothetical protein
MLVVINADSIAGIPRVLNLCEGTIMNWNPFELPVSETFSYTFLRMLSVIDTSLPKVIKMKEMILSTVASNIPSDDTAWITN